MSESPTVKRRRLGMLLRQFRTEAGLRPDTVASSVDRTESWLSRVERGRTGLTRVYLEKLLEQYGVGEDVATELADLAKGGRERGWWSRYAGILPKQYSSYIGFEAEASRLLIYEGLVVHGLLQTEEYARTVIRAANPDDPPTTIDRKVEVRIARQKRLAGESPLRLWVILDEAVLWKVIGGRKDVHLAQLDHLLALADEDSESIRIQVIPFEDSSYPGMLSSFTIMEFPGGDPELVYIEGLTGDLYEDPPESARYRLVFDNLRAAAKSETASRDLIARVRSEIAAA
jgi:transcriptional regulator with XRE-family HTH domain